MGSSLNIEIKNDEETWSVSTYDGGKIGPMKGPFTEAGLRDEFAKAGASASEIGGSIAAARREQRDGKGFRRLAAFSRNGSARRTA